MARLVCIHEIELTDEADAVEFERLFAEAATQIPKPEPAGWKTRLLRGDRGERAGRYAILYEIESVEARDRYFPADGQVSEDFNRFQAEHPAAAKIWQRLQGLVTVTVGDVYTDYLVVVE
jgi:hypothetical protein